MKRQFNVNLDDQLIRRVKHLAVDMQLSVSELVGRTLTALTEKEPAMTDSSAAPHVVLQPLVHVRDTAGTLALLELLGGRVEHGSRDGDFVLVSVGGAQVGLLAHPPNPEQGEGDVELTFTTTTPLEQVEAAAGRAGVEVAQPTTDEGFGRQLQLRTPDGLLVKIDELDQELYT